MSSDSQRNAVESLYQQDPALKDLLCEFAQDLPGSVRQLRVSFEKDDFSAAADQSHRLAGSSAIYGYDKLSQHFRHMEDNLRAATPDARTVEEELKTVESMIPKILSVLNVKERT